MITREQGKPLKQSMLEIMGAGYDIEGGSEAIEAYLETRVVSRAV